MSARFELEGTSTGAVRSLQAANAALDATEKNAEGAVKSNKKLEEQLQRSAQRIKEMVSPQERFNRLAQELRGHVEANRLSTEQADKALLKYHGDLLQASDAGVKAFGPKMLGYLDGMVGRMAAVAAPLALLKAGFDDIAAAVEKAKQESDSARRGMGSLRQLATTDAQFQDLRGKAEALYGTGATKSLDEAASAVFSLASAGQLDNKSFGTFTALAAKGVADPGTLARAVKNYSSAFGTAEAGDTRAIISKAFAASNYSPESVEALMAASPSVAGVAGALGISDEKTLASLAVLSSSVGGSQAATYIKAFLSGTAKDKGMAGLDIRQRVDALASRNLSFADLQKTLGGAEAATAMTLLSKNSADIIKAEADIQRANTDPFAIASRLQFTDPESDAALTEQAAINRSVLANRREAAFGAIRTGVLERQRQNLRDFANEGLPQRLLGGFGLGAMAAGEYVPEWGSSNEDWVRAAATHRGGQLNEGQQTTLDALNRSADAAERTNREIERLNRTVHQRRVSTRQE